MDEQELLDWLRSGDPRGFEQLVRSYGARMLATAARILADEYAAEDVVQDALVAAWTGIHRFEGASALSTWLHRIVVNLSLERLRKDNRRREVKVMDREGASLPFEGIPAAWSEPGPNLEKRVAMRRAIQRALQAIPDDLRAVLILRDVEELSSKETAQQLGIADAAVRQRLHRARVAMAELLRPELCDGPALTCGGQLDLLMDYLDEALPADLTGPVQDHISGCEPCTDLLATYRQTVGIPRAILDLTGYEEATARLLSLASRRAGILP